MAIISGDPVSAEFLHGTLLWGNTNYWEDETSKDIDSCIDSHTSDSSLESTSSKLVDYHNHYSISRDTNSVSSYVKEGCDDGIT